MSARSVQPDKAQPLVGIILTILSALLVVGMLTFAGPCAVQAAAPTTPCLGASRAVLGTAAMLCILSLVRIFERDEGERRGLDLGAVLMGILVALLPGTLVPLCADQVSSCHASMQPFCIGVGCAIALVAATDLTRRLLSLRPTSNQKIN